MLQSPGQSPRHILPASPGAALSSASSAIVVAEGAAAPKARKRAAVVLDEDKYVEAIERIIERDYFPDVPALRDRLDLLEAHRSGDPVLLRDAQLKILERRRRRCSSATPAAESSSFRFPSVTPTPYGNSDSTPSFYAPSAAPAVDDDSAVDDRLSLDKFMRMYTSEDNDSFGKIMEKVNKKRRERYAHLLEAEKEEVCALECEKQDRITDGYGTSGQPVSTLEGWKYKAKNLLMYNSTVSDEVPLTDEELAHRIKGMTKEINRSNTRFSGRLLDSRPKEEDAVAILYTPVAGATPGMVPFAGREAERLRKYDLEDLRKTPQQLYMESGRKEENGGYSFVRTPSPAPGVDESPFITWGEIEGTPLRLDGEDLPLDVGSADGPHYTIPNLPSRDLKAHSLSRNAARKLMDRSNMFRKPPLHSPARRGSMSPNIRTLSPAAQKFVRNAIAKSSSSVDESLRASYRGASPGVGTPKAGRSVTRFGRDETVGSRSPSVMEGTR